MSPTTLEASISNVKFTVDLDALEANYHKVNSYTAHGNCIPVVKADSYGCGMIESAKRLARAGARLLMVAQMEEAVKLRSVLPKVQIAVLDGLLPGMVPLYIQHNLIPVLSSYDQVQEWATDSGAAIDRPVMIHFDTGLNRIGMRLEEIDQLAEEKALLKLLNIHSYHSHLACSNMPDHELNHLQLERFKSILQKLPKARAGLAATNGLFLGPDYHFDTCRIGRYIYGVEPVKQAPEKATPVVSMSARILQIKTAKKGETTGYEATYKFDKDTRICTIGLGYADAILVSLSNKGICYIDGHKAPVIGRISMDLMTLDVSNVPEHLVYPGQFAEVIGPNNTINAIAAQCGAIPYEILTRLSTRHKRQYIGAVE